MFKKILIANRGEIAVRIHRAAREMGIATVAVHSEADADALHVKMANESVCIGPAAADKSYLNIPAIMAAAEVTNAEAIHPGYGFLSENAKFANIIKELGFSFVGPAPEHIDMMGDKVQALEFAKKAGVPTIPGSDGTLENAEQAIKVAERIGCPVLIKAAGGGGGRGMKVVQDIAEVSTAFDLATNEAQAAFSDGRVYVEKYLEKPRHVEVQVLCDSHGTIAVLGERDCSLQRRHQKLVEETPCPILTEEERRTIGDYARKLCEKLGYLGAGTLEFLYEDGRFYFIEMNTRLQVEHPITEMVTGIDLVREQIRVAAGEKLDITENIQPRGHAIECRITAEDSEKFIPSPGTITEYFPPGGLGVRVDGSIYSGYTVSPHYDPMIAKLIVHGADRKETLARLKRALEEFLVEGIQTTLPLHRRIAATRAFTEGKYDIHSLERFVDGEAM